MPASIAKLVSELRPNWERNCEGSPAYPVDSRLRLTMRLLTSTLKGGFYESDRTACRDLVNDVLAAEDPLFAAKAALFARTHGGLRSGPQLVGAAIAQTTKGQEWTTRFFAKLVQRPDDAVSLMQWIVREDRSRVPNAVKRGVGRALARFDAYQLAKYRRAHGDGLSLADVVNLVHPPHTEALGQLMRGTLPAADTWEVALSRAGDGTDAKEQRAKTWERLLKEDRLGYMALVRNLRTLLSEAPHLAGIVAERLVQTERIRRSRIFPFQIHTAWKEMLKEPESACPAVVQSALLHAVDLSLVNVPRFSGRTLVALDVSGSMEGRPLEIGSLFAAVLAKTSGAQLMVFSDTAEYRRVAQRFPAGVIAHQLAREAALAGTNFHAVFETAREPYERIIILSDMQAWIGGNTPDGALAEYERHCGCRPKIFCLDLAGHGTAQFPQERVCQLAGFTDSTLQILGLLEEEAGALLRKIETVAL